MASGRLPRAILGGVLNLVCAFAFGALGISLQLSDAFANDDVPGIDVPEGFKVELYADDDLAHDVHSMTLDSQGRVVVSGPGYVRILIDSDKDAQVLAVANITPRWSGTYFIKITMYNSTRNGAHYVVQYAYQ